MPQVLLHHKKLTVFHVPLITFIQPGSRCLVTVKKKKKCRDNIEFLMCACSFTIAHFQLFNQSILRTCYVPGTSLGTRENVTFIESSVCVVASFLLIAFTY